LSFSLRAGSFTADSEGYLHLREQTCAAFLVTFAMQFWKHEPPASFFFFAWTSVTAVDVLTPCGLTGAAVEA
jgi:hypothetical protein